MGEDTNRAVAEAWGRAEAQQDLGAVRHLAHPDYVLDWPQTGERIRGIDAAIGLDVDYPGGLPAAEITRISGSEDRWVVDATMLPRRIVGSGDVWLAEGSLHYPSGELWDYVSIIELRGGRVVHETQYFAPHLDPPAWRAGRTEALPQLDP